jgi:hypothetical protein
MARMTQKEPIGDPGSRHRASPVRADGGRPMQCESWRTASQILAARSSGWLGHGN